MRTLLVILAHSGASGALARHWPWYERAELDILGVDREDTVTTWPKPATSAMSRSLKPAFVGRVPVGKESYANGDNHLRRYLNVLDYCLTLDVHSKSGPYEWFVVCEYDTLFFKPFPMFEEGFTGTLAGHRSPGFSAENYYHTPWVTDRMTAIRIIHHGRIMLQTGLIEHGFLDRWLGLLVELYAIPTHDASRFTYCRNSIDTPAYVREARQAIADGAVMVHGVKTAAQLKQVTEGL